MLRKIATLALAAGLVAAASPALATSELYAGNNWATSYNANAEFMSVDDISDANPMTVIASGLSNDGIAGLAWNGSTQIMYGSSASTFFTVNVATGAKTSINAATTYAAQDLAFGPGGVLYGGASGGRLFSINTTTGAMTSIGVGAREIAALAYDPVSGIMYGSNGGSYGLPTDTYFFSINLSNGAQTQIGVGMAGNNIYGMSIDPATGVLYGAGWFNELLFDYGTYGTIDKSTGVFTQLNGSTPQPMSALAFIPEPGTMLLLGMGLVGLGISGRKKA